MPVAKVIEIPEYRADMKVTSVIHRIWEAITVGRNQE